MIYIRPRRHRFDPIARVHRPRPRRRRREITSTIFSAARVDLPTPTRPVRTTRPLSSTRRASGAKTTPTTKTRNRSHPPPPSPPSPTNTSTPHPTPSPPVPRLRPRPYAINPVSSTRRRRRPSRLARAGSPSFASDGPSPLAPSSPTLRRVKHHIHSDVPPHARGTTARCTQHPPSRVPRPRPASPRLGLPQPFIPIRSMRRHRPVLRRHTPPRAPSRHGDDDESVRDGGERASRPVLRDDDDENARGWGGADEVARAPPRARHRACGERRR